MSAVSRPPIRQLDLAGSPSAIGAAHGGTHAAEIRAVLMDVMMPEMRGDEAFLAMRRYDPDVRVVFSSGWSMDECLDRIPSDAIAGFLPKPYRHEALVARIRDVLEEPDSEEPEPAQ